MNSGIYIIINKKNGNRYVGSSVNLKKRFRDHRCYLRNDMHDNGHLQRSWNKYGEDVFEFRILFYCDPELCIAFEQRTMDVLDPEYNIAPVAGSCLGVKFGPPSDKTRAKMSAAQKGRTFSEEHRKKLSAANMGNRHSPETRAKMRGRKMSKESRAKVSAAHKGRRHSEETRAKISASVKTYWAMRNAIQDGICSS